MISLTASYSDTLVFFGATGDLAYKKIFPALQAMVNRGKLNMPVIGVAKSGWSLEQLKARAKDSLEKHGGLDPEAFEKLCGLLRYVDGDYNDAATFEALCRQLGSAQRPAFYLAIPPAAFGTVVEQQRINQQQEAINSQLKSALAQQQKDFQATAAHQQEQIEALTAGLQKVSAQVELNRSAPQIARQ
ncbi:MAG TPA: hypothetical protein VNY07_07730 [Chthoniobacterales bacterium]|jgi:glucose-6-phosphate 1-dehydrogenase|nr:hypothetical protein [Chthoniobacterales bacterium]